MIGESDRASGAPEAGTRRLTAPALRRGLDILELFFDGTEELFLPEIVARLGLPRASVHELVSTLVDRDYLRQVSDRPIRVALGVRSLQLGGAYERGLDLVELGRSEARKVAGQCQETVQIVVRDHANVVYLVRIDSTHSVRLVSDVGTQLPAHCTAGGKMLLSMLTAAKLDALLPPKDPLEVMTPHSIATRERLHAELQTTRERGWADEYCESNPDVACVAAPIFDATGQCLAAMSISVPVLRWSEEREAELLELVSAGAREVSTRLGAR